ncbi:hypothetical protein LCGC14_1689910, partial [marine sediment metagenome]
ATTDASWIFNKGKIKRGINAVAGIGIASVIQKIAIKSATPEELAELESIVAERLAEEAEDPD